MKDIAVIEAEARELAATIGAESATGRIAAALATSYASGLRDSGDAFEDYCAGCSSEDGGGCIAEPEVYLDFDADYYEREAQRLFARARNEAVA